MRMTIFHRLPIATAPGWRFWEDRFIMNNWRIQEHAHDENDCRLLNPRGKTVAKGSYDKCYEKFCEHRKLGNVKRHSSKVVLMVHGLNSSPLFFRPLEKHLRAAGYETAAIQYATNRRNVQSHGKKIAEMIERMEDLDELHFIGHSLGCLVLRSALTQEGATWRERIKQGRFVPLAGPNQGVIIANILSAAIPGPFKWFTGSVGKDATIEGGQKHPTPEDIDIGVVAGSIRGVTTATDGLVNFTETKLEGAKDTTIVNGGHLTMLFTKCTPKAVISFLETGKFDHPRIKRKLSLAPSKLIKKAISRRFAPRP